jgi:hypothetical protein
MKNSYTRKGSSSFIVRAVKLRRQSCVRHVGGKAERRNAQNPGVRDVLEEGSDCKRERRNFVSCSLIIRSYIES